MSITVIVQIGLKSQNEDLLKSFEEAVVKAPSVVSCHLMSGEDDYLVTVMARDLADFERIHKEQLSRLPGVARLKSSFALQGCRQPIAAGVLSPALAQIVARSQCREIGACDRPKRACSRIVSPFDASMNALGGSGIVTD